jgi:acetylornithine deacetylase/succinyl-diaminopimelate desuccinylase-like protein
VLLFIIALPALAADELTPFQKLGREVYQELIETDTTHSTGDTTKAAENLAKRFQAAGIPAADIHIVGPTNRNKNLIVRYRGTGARKPVLLLSHLDVVEAKREDWSLEPFKLTEKDGYFYGRGTEDDKGGVATLSTALLRLRQEGFQPDRDIILACTAGEEAAADYNGVDWLVENHKELVDCVLCFNADAGGPSKRGGKMLIYGVQAAEKVYLSFLLETKGPGGHSSRPVKDTPINRIAEAMVRIENFDFPVQFNSVTRGYLEQMSGVEGGQIGADMKAVLKNPPDADAVKRLAAVSTYYNAVLRTTAVTTMMEGGHAENALPQTARATVNTRIMPGESTEEVEKTLRKVIANDQITISIIEAAKPSPPSELTGEPLEAIRLAKEKLWPGLPIVPEMETGATDGLRFRQMGIPTFGITGIASDQDDVRIHGKDERVMVKDFYNGLEYEYQLIKAISSKTR